MKTILKHVGLEINENDSNGQSQIKLMVIYNTDGSPRWIWPAHLNKPLFLKFYNASSAKARLFNLLIQVLFFFKLQKFVFKTKTFFFTPDNSNIVSSTGNWALFTGTVGPNNKILVYKEENGKASFLKIATTEHSKVLLEREGLILERLKWLGVKHFSFPNILNQTENILEMNDISAGAKRSSNFSTPQINALVELNELTSFTSRLGDLEIWNDLNEDIKELLSLEDNRLPKGMIRKLKVMVNELNPDSEIEVGLTHRDFTPWNSFVKDNTVHIYDWELAHPFLPIGYDAFHFIIQNAILVERKNWKEIRSILQDKLNCNRFSTLSKFKHINLDDYLKLYLIFNSVYYLKIYAEQKLWHKQVYWLINTWNEALSSFPFKKMNNRELVLMDTFDFLLDKDYATIKFPLMVPENLSELSDVDMCVDKRTPSSLLTFFKNHPLVQRTKQVNKTFMSTQQIICADGGILSLDLIWKMKRKNLEMLDVKNILPKAYTNMFGIKMMDIKDNTRYIGLFYLLNNAAIPGKYKAYEQILEQSENPLDNLLNCYFIDDTGNKQQVFNYIKNQKANKGWSHFLNSLAYYADVAKSFIGNRGTVISFSGVDGAGKSTIIENLAFKIEKQLRRRVVVLRHRPSILPILSAWTKGKENAEKEAASNLPRRGNNKSFMSSLARFMYYYCDYVIGQFIVYFKYVLRGYVVIYDRYYFDFINDSKRSNIILPVNLVKKGLLFIIRPKLNFFLYAKPEVILNRKQELDKQTIEELTASYINLFESLNRSHKRSHYTAIENIELNHTLNTVFKTLTKTAA